MDENTKKENRQNVAGAAVWIAGISGYTAYKITQLVLNHKGKIEHMRIAHNSK